MKTIKIMRTLMAMLIAVATLAAMPMTAFAANDSKTVQFELPLEGATGFACSRINLRESAPNGKILKVLEPGTAFTILADGDKYLKVDCDGTIGYAYKAYVMVNLPDIIPSIVYYDSNSESAIYQSSEKDLPQITGEQLYNVKAANPRFGGEVQYVMPILLSMAYKVQMAQNVALENGDSLMIYETFRPYDTQMSVSDSLSDLMNSDATVRNNINTAPWGKGWFIATSRSNHQRGMAMDVSLVRVEEMETRKCGSYTYQVVTEYEEYEMPTQMHELSPAAATFTTPVSSSTITGWKKCQLSEGMLKSEGALKLQQYCTESGLTPLASEWWHFEDQYSDKSGKGDFYLLGGKPNADGTFSEVMNVTSQVPTH